MVEVAVVRWPSEMSRRDRLALEGLPRRAELRDHVLLDLGELAVPVVLLVAGICATHALEHGRNDIVSEADVEIDIGLTGYCS